MEESQGWLIDLGMVLIVSMMERQDSSLCVCMRIDHVPGGGGSWWVGGGGNAQGFANAWGQTAAKVSPRRKKRRRWQGLCAFNPRIKEERG